MLNKLSCIIPVYNGEEYLEKTFSCLKRQTYRDFELIIINDASDDKTEKIIEHFMSVIQQRIIYIRNDSRLGAAKSRNLGLAKATGEYVIFLDADDIYYQGLFEQSINAIEQDKADMVVFGYEKYNYSTKEVSRVLYEKRCYVDRNDIILWRMLDNVPWNKVVRKKLLEEHQIYFQDIPSNNDIFFSFVCGLTSKKIVFINDMLIRYVWKRPASLTLTRERKNYVAEAYYEIYNYIEKNKYSLEIKREFINFLLDTYQRFLISIVDNKELTKQASDKFVRLFLNDSFFARELEQETIYAHNRAFLQALENGKTLQIHNKYDYYWETIKTIIEDRKKEEKKIALWGAGKLGRDLLQVLNCKKIFLNGVIDKNVNKQGVEFEGYIVESCQAAVNYDVFIITNVGIKDEIKQLVGEKEVINCDTL